MVDPATTAERASETVELRGHVIDSGILGSVLDEVIGRGADYEIARFEVGKHHTTSQSCCSGSKSTATTRCTRCSSACSPTARIPPRSRTSH